MYTITKKQALATLKLLKATDENARLIAHYSGKFMFGATCVGYVTSNPGAVSACLMAVLIADGIEATEALEIVGSPSEDSMALDFILYFTYLTVEG